MTLPVLDVRQLRKQKTPHILSYNFLGIIMTNLLNAGTMTFNVLMPHIAMS